MRISTQMMYEQNMSGITNSQAEWMKLGEQMSTGKRVTNPSDDPIAASQAVVLSQAQAQNSQYALARTFATQKVSLEESVLSQVTTAIQTAQEKIVYAGNGTLSDDDRASLATDLQGIRDQLMNLANSTDAMVAISLPGIKRKRRHSTRRQWLSWRREKCYPAGGFRSHDGNWPYGCANF
ncbi:flagellar hook-associated protein 3 [Salmonella enterica subsp. enterica serovar Typhimurium]|nr:flagellar hook-associated protein 3 [Salmonella enterica subsp. enterica serovar Typhimurium]